MKCGGQIKNEETPNIIVQFINCYFRKNQEIKVLLGLSLLFFSLPVKILIFRKLNVAILSFIILGCFKDQWDR